MHAKAKSEKFQGAPMNLEADMSAAGELVVEAKPQAVADNQSDEAKKQAAKEDDKQQETPKEDDEQQETSSAQAGTQKTGDTESVDPSSLPSFAVGEIVLGLAKKQV